MGGDGSTEVVTVGLRNKLTCTWNFTVIPEKTVDDIQLDEFDALAIQEDLKRLVLSGCIQ